LIVGPRAGQKVRDEQYQGAGPTHVSIKIGLVAHLQAYEVASENLFAGLCDPQAGIGRIVERDTEVPLGVN
jgi:hypothetical protein